MGFLDRLRAAFGSSSGAPAAPALPAGTVEAPLETSEQGISGTGNYGGRLQVEPNQALRDVAGYGQSGGPEWGEWEEARRSNPYVAMALDFVCSPIRDARIDFEEPPEGTKYDAAAMEAQIAFLRWNFTDGLDSPLPSVLAQTSSGMLASGFAILEPVGGPVAREELPGGKGLALKKLAERLPNSLHPNPWLESPDGGELLAIRQQGPKGPSGQWVTVTLPREDVLHFIWQKSGNNWAGFSALRPAWYIANRTMPQLLKLVGVTLQREGGGVPTAVATDPKTPLTPTQRDELKKLFAGFVFHEASGVVMPPGWDLKWIFSPGANKGHVLQAWRDLGLVILQLFGAQQLVLGTGETGSRSVGEVHDARAQAYVRGVVAVLESELQRLVRKLVDVNWGPQKAYPRLKLTLKRPELGVKERLEAMGLAKNAGLLTVLPRDENMVRESLGMSPIDDKERDDAKAKAAALAPKIDEQDRPAGGAGEKDADSDVASPASNPRSLKASAPRGEWKPWRALRASESKLQLREMDAYFVRRRDDFEKRAKPVVVGMLALAATAIEKAMADGEVTPAEVAAVTLDETRLKKLIADYLRETREAGASFVREELRARPLTAAEEEQDDKGGAAEKVVEEADEVVDAEAERLRKRIVNRLRLEVEREAIDTVRTGGDASEVVTRTVARQIDTGAFKADAGSVTAKVFNVGRDEAARLMGGVAQVELSAILDSGTCEVCVALDGTRADFNSDEHDRLLPPVRDCAGGDNCRCVLVFIPGGNE